MGHAYMEKVAIVWPNASQVSDQQAAPREPEALDRKAKIDLETLSPAHLLSNRIVSFDSNSELTRNYDALRNQLLVDRDVSPPQVIAVVAPTAGCGTTTTAVNLALSFARARPASALLVDTNTRAPAIGRTLGLAARSDTGADASYGILRAVMLGDLRVHVLCSAPWTKSSSPPEENARRVELQIDHARQLLEPSITVLDVPPMLVADEASPLLQKADAVVLVLARGQSTLSDLTFCRTYLDSTKRVQIVLNKCGRHGL